MTDAGDHEPADHESATCSIGVVGSAGSFHVEPGCIDGIDGIDVIDGTDGIDGMDCTRGGGKTGATADSPGGRGFQRSSSVSWSAATGCDTTGCDTTGCDITGCDTTGADTTGQLGVLDTVGSVENKPSFSTS